MPLKIKGLTSRLFKPKTPQSTDKTTPPPADAPPVYESSKSELVNPPLLENLWQSAYNRLDPKEQNVLTQLEGKGNGNTPTAAIIDKVIRTTEEQYERYQGKALKIRRSTGEDIDLRSFSHKIINAALSFKHVIDAVVALDPTQHAASAWTVVSLGLTIGKNRMDLQDALFDSSEYLADVLARHAYIEKNFYHSGGKKAEIGHAIVKVYTAVLRYAAEVLAAQNSGAGRWIRDSLTAIGEQRLTELKVCVQEEGVNLHQWVQLDQLLKHGEQAESILDRIDRMSESLKSLVKTFGLPIAEGASYDSYMNQHEDTCLPDTRVELLSQIANWAESPDGKCIFWLKGMAGTGKSTIARTVAQYFNETGILGASFFFKRGEQDRGNAKRLITTVVKQLITKNPRLAAGVLEAIKNDPDIASKALSQQFEKLLLQPLIDLKRDESTSTVVVIDALDECEQEEDIRVLLHLLPQLQKSKSLNMRVFLTSRPELPVRIGFQHIQGHQDLELHELPLPVIERDIRLFLEDRLRKIQQDHALSPDWPGEDIMDVLVSKSVPLFIFAATLCRFIGERYQVPEDRLDAFLQDSASTSGSQMERMYLPLLNELLAESQTNDFIKELHDVLGVIILLAAPLSTKALAQLIQYPERRIRSRLAAFHSVLRVSTDCDAPIRTLHSSFGEFLLNTTSVFHVDGDETHRKIALNCLDLMNSGLKQNICGLSNYGTQRAELDARIIETCLPAEIQYSCRYWVHHLEQCKDQILEKDLLPFLRRHFLHWLEAMSLMGLLASVVNMINTLQSITRSESCRELPLFLNDAKLFVLKHIYICHDFPLQLYCSGLAFLPPDSIIKNVFQESQRWVHFVPITDNTDQMATSSPKDNTSKPANHSESIVSVTFSPDGLTLASGSKDSTIKLWDTTTGQQLRTLEGHSGSVSSVFFSPDGHTIASGSYDTTIQLWDATAGQQLRTLEGHLDSVISVAFSPNGQFLASGSDDNTVRMWDVQNGRHLHTMEGHTDWIQSVVFSPNGTILASGSYDNTIKLWDPKTFQQMHTLEGHSGLVASVAFSPDGQILASGSYDHTIRLWDTESGQHLQTLEGHSGLVRSVVFSPDRQIIISASYDTTIKYWDATTYQLIRTINASSSPVRSVAVSPDSQTVASGAYDNTIKLWSTKTGEQLRDLAGHQSELQPEASSAEGQVITSDSPLCVENGWVTFEETKVLWLPFDYHLFSSAIAEGSTLVLRYPDGRVCAMEFRVPSV